MPKADEISQMLSNQWVGKGNKFDEMSVCGYNKMRYGNEITTLPFHIDFVKIYKICIKIQGILNIQWDEDLFIFIYILYK